MPKWYLAPTWNSIWLVLCNLSSVCHLVMWKVLCNLSSSRWRWSWCRGSGRLVVGRYVYGRYVYGILGSLLSGVSRLAGLLCVDRLNRSGRLVGSICSLLSWGSLNLISFDSPRLNVVLVIVY